MAHVYPGNDPQVLASRAVLIEVVTILGAYMDNSVVIGGWVPEIHYPGRGHIGSIDVDLALDGRKIQAAAYDPIRRRLLKAGYRQDPSGGSIFYREVGTLTVKLDLITGEGEDSEGTGLHTQIQEMIVGKLRGTDLAFDNSVSVSITGKLPDGSENVVRIRVATPASFICMKAHAMNERKKEKDAYDIWFCLRNYEGGPEALASSLQPLLGHPIVDEAISILREKFESIDRVGPQWSAQVAHDNGDDFERVARDAFERMRVFLAALSST